MESSRCRIHKLSGNKNRMKKIEITALVSMWILSTITPPVKASIQADFRKIEARREALEERRKKYEANTIELEENLQSASLNYRSCTSGPWGVFFNARINRANEERRKLEEEKRTPLRDLKNQLQRINKELEIKREGIERAYRIKNFEYENVLRNWMETIEIKYFLRLEGELFDGYGQYQNGIEQYIAFINGLQKHAETAIIQAQLLRPLLILLIKYIQEENSRALPP